MNTIEAPFLCKMFLSGAKNLENNKEWINELNVFPVPDGDTGTNMTLTILSAVKEVENLTEMNMVTLSKAISSGSLRGARGNSGVILSQLFRGFTKELKTVEVLNRVSAAKALQKATETAYKAVMKPKEGTILTVAKGISDKALELAEQEGDLETFLEEIIRHGDYVLSQTPELLPVLKEAGVVDSGGQGLMLFLKGAYDCMMGKDLFAEGAEEEAAVPELKYEYCTEFVIELKGEFSENQEFGLKSYLEELGDEVAVVTTGGKVLVHVHTNDPGLILQKGLTYGSLTRIQIDNRHEEFEEALLKEIQETAAKAQKEAAERKAEAPRKESGFIAVSIGEGLNEVFRGLNVDYIIEGGQTMNPSTDDMLKAIDQVNADTIFILPNNKNIILAAEQATYLVIDKKVIVVPSTTVPQGIAALINYSPSRTPEENLETMTEEMGRVKTGQVTYAVRNTTIDEKPIHEGDIMGIGDHSALLAVGQSVEAVTREMMGAMVDEESELISIYYGLDVALEDAEALRATAEELYPDCDVELHYGGQPIYYYVVSVE